MAEIVTENSLLMCTQGVAPCPLQVVTNTTVNASSQKIATINDFSIASIPTFGICHSPANPEVIAALGVPQPCVPLIITPWTPPSPKTTVMAQPAFGSGSKCLCAYAGEISVITPSQLQTNVD